jgi:ankyrin repeat protein
VQELLKVRGVDVNLSSKEKDSPLHFAAFEGDPEVVSWLIEKGAEVIGFLTLFQTAV